MYDTFSLYIPNRDYQCNKYFNVCRFSLLFMYIFTLLSNLNGVLYFIFPMIYHVLSNVDILKGELSGNWQSEHGFV